jgi:hypothetical protein
LSPAFHRTYKENHNKDRCFHLLLVLGNATTKWLEGNEKKALTMISNLTLTELHLPHATDHLNFLLVPKLGQKLALNFIFQI